MPDWLVSTLIQYPIVVVIGFVAWYSYRKVERANDGRIARDERLYSAAVEDLKQSHRQAVAEYRAEVERLVDEVRRLGRKIDELNRRMSG